MMYGKKISVAMTTYNGEKYIREQINSIINQSVAIDEIIVCDDRSEDQTVEIIKSLKNPKINLIINERRLGYIENFYKAISLTKGNYIFLADQDDIWVNTKVEKIISIMEQECCTAVCSNFNLIDSDGKVISDRDKLQMNPFLKKVSYELSPITLRRLAFGNIVQGCTYCFTKEVREIYLKINNKEVIHDYQIMLIAAHCGKVLFYNEPLIEYRLHGSNAVGFSEKNRKVEIKKLIPSKIPFMMRFFMELNKIKPITYVNIYYLLYIFRIPYLLSIFRRVTLGE